MKHDPFRRLTPPPGGLADLRARMAPRPARRWQPWLIPASLALAGLLIAVLPRSMPITFDDPALSTPTAPVEGRGGTPVRAVQVSPEVVFFLVHAEGG